MSIQNTLRNLSKQEDHDDQAKQTSESRLSLATSRQEFMILNEINTSTLYFHETLKLQSDYCIKQFILMKNIQLTELDTNIHQQWVNMIACSEKLIHMSNVQIKRLQALKQVCKRYTYQFGYDAANYLLTELTTTQDQLNKLSGHYAIQLLETHQNNVDYTQKKDILTKIGCDQTAMLCLANHPKWLEMYLQKNQQFIVNMAHSIVSETRRLYINTVSDEWFANTKKHPEQGPNRIKFQMHSKQLENFIQNDILNQKSLHARAIHLERWIWVMDETLNQSDYHSFQTIFGALSRVSIYRLKETWDHISEVSRDRYNYLQKKYRPGSTTLKDEMERNEDCIPSMLICVAGLSRLGEQVDDIKTAPQGKAIYQLIESRRQRSMEKSTQPIFPNLIKQINKTSTDRSMEDHFYQQSKALEASHSDANQHSSKVTLDLPTHTPSMIANPLLLDILMKQHVSTLIALDAETIHELNQSMLTLMTYREFSAILTSAHIHLTQEEITEIHQYNKQCYYRNAIINPVIKQIVDQIKPNETLQIKSQTSRYASLPGAKLFNRHSTLACVNAINDTIDHPVKDDEIQRRLNALGIRVTSSQLAAIQAKNKEIRKLQHTDKKAWARYLTIGGAVIGGILFAKFSPAIGGVLLAKKIIAIKTAEAAIGAAAGGTAAAKSRRLFSFLSKKHKKNDRTQQTHTTETKNNLS